MNEFAALDLLTVLVELQHRDLDKTVVRYWAGGKITAGSSWETIRRSLQPPRKLEVCLRCFCVGASTYVIGDGRGSVVEAVQRGEVQVLEFYPRPAHWLCPRCQAPLHQRMLTQSELSRFPRSRYIPPPHLPPKK